MLVVLLLLDFSALLCLFLLAKPLQGEHSLTLTSHHEKVILVVKVEQLCVLLVTT